MSWFLSYPRLCPGRSVFTVAGSCYRHRLKHTHKVRPECESHLQSVLFTVCLTLQRQRETGSACDGLHLCTCHQMFSTQSVLNELLVVDVQTTVTVSLRLKKTSKHEDSQGSSETKISSGSGGQCVRVC